MDWFNELPGIDELESAEDFFNYLSLNYDAKVLSVKHLHIMHDFHHRLKSMIPTVSYPAGSPAERAQCLAILKMALAQSYAYITEGQLAERSTLRVYQQELRYFIPFSALDEVQE